VSEVIRLVIDVLRTAWPLRIVYGWERGVYLFCGRAVCTLGPGIKLVCPGLSDVRPVSIVPWIAITPLQSVTLRDGSTLTYSATLTVVVRDPEAAYTRIDHYHDTVIELSARIVSEELEAAEIDRFEREYGKRARLMEAIREKINAECGRYGLEVQKLGMNNFVRGVRTVRLLLDRAVLGTDHPRAPA
jgi:regulator of protease activity HflC (stomatin/prohibitin superfamily)